MGRKPQSATGNRKRAIKSYTHEGKERLNNPPVGLVTPETDRDTGKKEYQYDPHLDPQLLWAGKAEHTSFEVPTVSLHVHERIDSRSIVEAVRKKNGNGDQPSLFEGLEENPPIRSAIEFYKHPHNWSNRLIAGDSLLVMNSLLEKEGLGGQVQMIYIDPPYGIKYGSNFQPFVNKRDVKDGKDEDLNQEPEQIRAFRDTWELGIHSYLTYLRDRLLLARELLHESGSIFVQISDENVHHVRELMDEVMGVGNFVSVIPFVKTSGKGGSGLDTVNDFLIWYGQSAERVKYRQLYVERSQKSLDQGYTWIEQPDGSRRRLTTSEIRGEVEIPEGRRFISAPLNSQSGGDNARFDVELDGKVFVPTVGYWKTNPEGMGALRKAKRLIGVKNTLAYVRYADDFPMVRISNWWGDTQESTFAAHKIYAVQTYAKVIERCLLMTTDPGDIVFDPTCLREGTGVWVAEGAGLDYEEDPLRCQEEPPLYSLRKRTEPPLYSPRKRGEAGKEGGSDSSPVYGGGWVGVSEAAGCVAEEPPYNPPVNGGIQTPSPFTGRVGEGLSMPVGEGFYRPIESVRPGQFVLSHDGQFHRITHVIKKRYSGTMVGIRHSLTDQYLWTTADHRVLVKRRHYVMSGQRDWSHTPGVSFERARALRKELTTAENTLWHALRRDRLGAGFRKQHPIGPYIVDFFCAERSLIVEVDGDSHFTPEAAEYDSERTRFLSAMGLEVLRFTNVDIAENREGVIDQIRSAMGEPAEGNGEEAYWLSADRLRLGDMVLFGVELQPVEIIDVRIEESTEDVYDLKVEQAHSFLTDVCLVHNCGSGTTAYVAEQWGRRWVTCDTSRVAVTLAKQRLMTAVFDYYELAHPAEGVGSGFNYKTVPHITLKSIANNPEIREGMTREQIDTAIGKYADQETLYDQPHVDTKKVRVTGPFTVEAVPAPVVKALDELYPSPALPVNNYPSPALPVNGEGECIPPFTRGLQGGRTGLQEVDISIARTGETLRQSEWRDELFKTGIRGKGGQRIEFSRVEPLPGTRWLHADAETRAHTDPLPGGEGENKPRRVVVSFGPEHAPLEQRQVALAIEEAQTLVPRPSIIVFAAFQFDPEAAKDIDETNWPGVTLLKAQMNADLLTEDLKKKRASNESFWLIGQPDVRAEKIHSGEHQGKWRVEVLGFDYYNTRTGIIESGGQEKIAMWLLDPDYDGRSLFPRQVFFPMAAEGEGWAKLAKNLKAEIDQDLIEAYRGTVSLPFEAGEHKRIAVKIIDDRGIESLRILGID